MYILASHVPHNDGSAVFILLGGLVLILAVVVFVVYQVRQAGKMVDEGERRLWGLGRYYRDRMEDEENRS